MLSVQDVVFGGDAAGNVSRRQFARWKLGCISLLTLLFAWVSNSVFAAASSIAVGNDHACAVTTSGAVQCWGSNAYGQLGDNSFVIRSAPVAVSGLASGVASVGAGWIHSCALTSAGGVRCWGANFDGQLGNGSTTTSAVPVNTTGLTAGVAVLSVGQGHNCAVTTAGALKCWGANSYGQLGDGTTTARSTPIDVTGLGSGVASVATGNGHTCAQMTSGGVKCWGANANGQLGDGTTTSRLTPVDVSGLPSGISAIVAGYLSTCAITSSGTMKCWGYNAFGQLGDGTSTQRTTPVDVVGVSGVAEIAAGWYHTCARRTDGALVCWGANVSGQLGVGGRTNVSTPPTTPTLSNGVQHVAAGGNGQTCVIAGSASGIFCWGNNASGQLGTGMFGAVISPAAVTGLSSGTTSFGLGTFHTCAVSGGAAKCWGYGPGGQLGDGTNPLYRTTPGNVTGLSSGVTSVVSGVNHACALTSAGAVKCWGQGGSGSLGNGSTTSSGTPVDVTGLGAGVTAISSAGGQFTCALTGGGVKCWGLNFNGQLGDGTTTNRSTPVDVTGLTSGVTAIAAGATHACAVTTGGAVKCWGANEAGQLGNSSTVGSPTPVDVVGLPGAVTGVTAGGAHSCAVTGGGAAYCWGRNTLGQLGAVPYTNRSTAALVAGTGSYATVSAGTDHTCALMADSSARCWGSNASGELGLGSMFSGTATASPVTSLGNTVAGIAAGGATSCARSTGGVATCWGRNDYGQVGNGSTSVAERPGNAVVGHAASVTSLASSVNPSVAGQSVTFTATVVGTNPSGSVNFTAGSTSISGCAAAPVVNGVATCSTTAMPIGSSSIAAAYGGDANNPASTSNTVTQVVNPLPATLSLASSVNPSRSGEGVTFTVSVSGVNPGGSVTFHDGAAPIAGCVAVALTPGNPATASCGPVSTLAVGVHSIVVTYPGDANNGAASTLFRQSVALTASSVVPGLALGSSHSCAIRSDGTLRCWGSNINYGEVGDGGSANRASPVAVAGLPTAKAVASAYLHACAIDSAGATKCWGANVFGGLGDGTTVDSNVPVTVSGLSNDVVDIATGAYHSCALRSNGSVACWGYNSSGQLGVGDNDNRTTPVDVINLGAAVVQLAAGGNQTCALLADGKLKCWGAARIGDGTITSRNLPTHIVALGGTVARVAVGTSNICALLVGGGIQCWGSNGAGQLGDGTTTARALPTTVPGVTNATTVSTNGSETCVVASGGAQCWGSGIYGKLGDGVVQSINTTAQPVTGLATGVSDVRVGGNHVCALTVGGGVRCWGRNTEGQLGDGSFGVALTPTTVSNLTGAAKIAAGGFHACSVSPAGGLKCWGSNSQGTMANGTTSPVPQTSPLDISSVAGPIGTVALGLAHSCVTTTSNQLQCWGGNGSGQVGDGTTVARTAPVAVTGLATASSASGAYSHSCAVTTTGGAKCWGAGQFGQLGVGGPGWPSAGVAYTATDVFGLTSGVSEVATGGNRSCARTVAGALKCWGDNAAGGLGDGTTTPANAPVDVQGLSSGVTSVVVGSSATCALLTGGAVKCWGDNFRGAVGDGTTTNRLAPVDVTGLGSGVVAISASGEHVCALTTAGGVKCWGANFYGQIGDGTLETRTTPTDVVGLTSGVVAIAAGVQFNCALLAGGSVKCWGDNQGGQMGDGTVGYSRTPGAYVQGPSLTQPLAIADAATVTAARDATIITRYLLGMTGTGLTSGNVVGLESQRTDPAQLLAYLETIRPLLDIDGDGRFDALSDGLLLMRYLLGVRGDALIAGALGIGATRGTSAAVEGYLAVLLP